MAGCGGNGAGGCGGGSSLLCLTSTCLVRLYLTLARCGQYGHLKGLAPVWITVCLRQSFELPKVLPQVGHACILSVAGAVGLLHTAAGDTCSGCDGPTPVGGSPPTTPTSQPAQALQPPEPCNTRGASACSPRITQHNLTTIVSQYILKTGSIKHQYSQCNFFIQGCS